MEKEEFLASLSDKQKCFFYDHEYESDLKELLMDEISMNQMELFEMWKTVQPRIQGNDVPSGSKDTGAAEKQVAELSQRLAALQAKYDALAEAQLNSRDNTQESNSGVTGDSSSYSMFFTTIPADCVMDIVKRLENPFDIRNVKMVNERTKAIVDGFNLDKVIPEIRFWKKGVYVKTDDNSEPTYIKYLSRNKTYKDVSGIVKQASGIEHIYISDETLLPNLYELRKVFTWIGISGELPIKHLHIDNYVFNSFRGLTKFLNSSNYQQLHFNNLYFGNYKEYRDCKFFAIKNLRSVTFDGQANDLKRGPNFLAGLRLNPLEKVDLRPLEQTFRLADVFKCIKFAMDENLNVRWNFGEIGRTLNENEKNHIHCLKNDGELVSFKIRTKDFQEYYKMKSANGTFKFSAKPKEDFWKNIGKIDNVEVD